MNIRLLLVTTLFLLSSIGLSAQKFDRGIDTHENPTFIPKGTLLFGGTVSYKNYNFDNYDFYVIDGMDMDGYSIKVSPHFTYFFKNNLSAGAKFTYKRNMLKVDKLPINLSDELNLEIKDYYRIEQTFYGSAIFRNYVSLGGSLRFAIFNEIALSVGGGQSKLTSGTGVDVVGTYQNIFELGLGLVPGIVAFVTDQVAVEASIGLLGLKYRQVKQIGNQIYEGGSNSFAADFKVDVFSINIGLCFTIPVGK